MMQIRKITTYTMLLGIVLLAACSTQKEPAKKVIADVETAISEAGPDAQQYVPDQLSSVSNKLADLKSSFEKHDYKTIVDSGPTVISAAKALSDASAAKKKLIIEGLNSEWSGFSTTLPQLILTLETRLATLSKARKLPTGLTKELIATETKALAETKTVWIEASQAFGANDAQGAVDKAKGVKAKLGEIAIRTGTTPTAR
jgi:hypothetical protein